MAQDQKNKNLLARVKAWYDHVTHKDDPHYISGKEARRIARENFKITREYERKKRRRVSEQDYLSEMKNEDNILEIENLHTYFFTDAGVAKSVDGVSFEVPKRSVVGVVGESGCGKSVTSLSVMQLVQAPQGQIVGGSIRFASQDYQRDEAGKPIPIWVYEETGAQARHWKALFSAYSSPGGLGEVLHIFLATGLEQGEMQLDEGEFLFVQAVPLETARQWVFSGEIEDMKTIAGVLAAMANL